MADLAGHSAKGMARVSLNYQARRPSLMDFAEAFSRSPVPTLLIVGEEDAPCVETSRWLGSIIPNAELVTLPGAGHAPNMEDPDGFNRAVEAFIDAVEHGD